MPMSPKILTFELVGTNNNKISSLFEAAFILGKLLESTKK